jgi:hypothetical protein
MAVNHARFSHSSPAALRYLAAIADSTVRCFGMRRWLGRGLGGGVEIVVDMERQRSKVEGRMAKRKIKAMIRSIPRRRKNELRANLLELSEACPFHHANPRDCPLFPLRKMEPKKRVQWFNALIEDDLMYLATYHRVCFTTKIESGLAKQQTKVPAKKGRRRSADQ